MAYINNEEGHRLLARAVGVGLLAAFGVAIYQTATIGDGALEAAAQQGADALFQSLRGRMVLDSLSVGLAVLVAVGFYLILRPVHALLALAASALRLVSAAFTAFGVYSSNALIGEISGASPEAREGLIASSVAGLNALNFDLFHWGLIASSIGAGFTFALLFVSRFTPRVLSGFGVLASLGAVTGASAIYLAPALSEAMYPAYVAANALAYISLMLWLLVFGVNVRHWNARD